MSNRIARVNALITKELGEIIRSEIDLPSGILVTVIKTDAAVDLKTATVYLSVLPDQKAPSTFKLLMARKTTFQRLLNRRLHMKSVPQLKFERDTGQRQAALIEELLQDERGNRSD